ncbi:MAG: type II toxin-antitoxin system HicA family toxin [Planctomycetaceae bacterium]
MRLPRDESGRSLAKRLRAFGYELTRQTGSHMRLSTTQNGEHHVTVPDHDSLRIGTLGSILNSVAARFGITQHELMKCLFPAD